MTGAGAHLLEIRNRREKSASSSGYVVRFKQLVAQAAYTVRQIDYQYDALSRLIAAVYSDAPDYAYAYDVAGNLTNNNGVTRTFNAANQMTGDGTSTYEYDNNGNLLKINGVNSYTWDKANRLLAFGGINYAYNGDGNRVSHTASSIVTKYLLDTQPGLALVIAQTTGANTERYIHAPRGIHAVENQAGNWSYMLQDGLGSVRGVVDATGTTAASHNYSPYGVPDAPLSGFAFTGEQRDTNGLQYHRARYYNSALGIFPSLDPFEGISARPMSLNGYSWVEGNPVMNIDPSGMQSLSECINCCFASHKNLPDLERTFKYVEYYRKCVVGITFNCLTITPTPAPATSTPTLTPTIPQCPTPSFTSTSTSVPPTSTPPAPTSSETAILFFGGSRGTGTLDAKGPRTECQTPVWHDVADQVVRYPGTQEPDPNSGFVGKRLQASQAGAPQARTLVIGYSAGADAALIYAYDYKDTGNIKGVVLLDGTLDGMRTDGRALGCIDNDSRAGCINGNDTDVWKDMFNDLLQLGISIYFLDDNAGGGQSKVGIFSPSVNNGMYKYDQRLNMEHISDINTGKRGIGTNNSTQLCKDILGWFGENTSKCDNETPKDCTNPF